MARRGRVVYELGCVHCQAFATAGVRRDCGLKMQWVSWGCSKALPAPRGGARGDGAKLPLGDPPPGRPAHGGLMLKAAAPLDTGLGPCVLRPQSTAAQECTRVALAWWLLARFQGACRPWSRQQGAEDLVIGVVGVAW